MTKPLWQLMIDRSDEALGAKPSGIYSAEDALIAGAHMEEVLLWLTAHCIHTGFANSHAKFLLVGECVTACDAASAPDKSPAYDQGGSHPQPSTHENH
jgi:hypothetical protein